MLTKSQKSIPVCDVSNFVIFSLQLSFLFVIYFFVLLFLFLSVFLKTVFFGFFFLAKLIK